MPAAFVKSTDAWLAIAELPPLPTIISLPPFLFIAIISFATFSKITKFESSSNIFDKSLKYL